MSSAIVKVMGDFKVSYRRPRTLVKVLDSRSAADAFTTKYIEDGADINRKEFFYCMYLNRANNVIGIERISEGGITGTVVDVRLIAQSALLANACSVILCHNHPSGQLIPSQSDKTLTKQLKEALKLLEITVIDHIILTKDGFEEYNHYSFADEGGL